MYAHGATERQRRATVNPIYCSARSVCFSAQLLASLNLGFDWAIHLTNGNSVFIQKLHVYVEEWLLKALQDMI